MVFIIAVGIGASTAVFTIVDQTLFRLPPYANADRLVQVIHLAPVAAAIVEPRQASRLARAADDLRSSTGPLRAFVFSWLAISCFRGWFC
jgi:hypothetical protein